MTAAETISLLAIVATCLFAAAATLLVQLKAAEADRDHYRERVDLADAAYVRRDRQLRAEQVDNADLTATVAMLDAEIVTLRDHASRSLPMVPARATW